MDFGKHEDKKTCSIPDVMEKFGRYQIFQYIFISLPVILITMINVNFVFAVGEVEYRCRVEECENANSTVQFPNWWPDTNIDRCSRPVLKEGENLCTNESFTENLTTCDRWIYENMNTVISEFNLACQPWKSNIIGTIHSTGMLLCMIVAGWMSDKFGRKPTLIFCGVGGFLGIIKTFITSYHVYIVTEFIEATLTGGTYAAAMVILLEIAGKKYRLFSGITLAYGIYFGECIFAIIAMFVPYWRTLLRVINGPCIFFILLIFFLNESPRWQIVTGRVDKVKRIIFQIAKMNKLVINIEEIENIDETKLKEQFNISKNEVKESVLHAIKSKEIMKRMFVVGVSRFTCNFVYYGMMINSVFLPGDRHVNFLLSTVMSFPGELISLYLMYKIGRKIPLITGFSLCGILCIISAFTPSKYKWLKVTIFLIAKMVISACFTGAVTYSMELFPTSVRGSLLGFSAFCSQLGNMLTPLTPILTTVSEVIPFVIFGCLSILTSLLIILTPETKNLPLFDTIKQVENHEKSEIKLENIETKSKIQKNNNILLKNNYFPSRLLLVGLSRKSEDKK